jgi:hypothetical protein
MTEPTLRTLACAGGLLFQVAAVPAASPPASRTPELPLAGKADPVGSGAAAAHAAQGWIELVGDPKLENWKRVASSDKPVEGTSRWSYDAATGILSCDGTGLRERLLHPVKRSDGVLRVEWRFPADAVRPSAGLVVRTEPDGSAWFQVPLAAATVGTIFGAVTDAAGGTRRFSSGVRRPELLKKGDEWNVAEITCIGTRLTVRINGGVAADWNGCTVAAAHVGLEADGSPVEFRGIKYKPLL